MDVPATEVRVPPRAKAVLADHGVVEVTNHGSQTMVMLHPDDFAAVRGLLERRRQGLPVPIDDLLDDDDLALLEELRADDGGIPVATSGSWA